MGILQITTDTTGQINVNPRRVKILSTDNLATVTAAGYLNSSNLEGYTILPTDVIDMRYSVVVGGSAGTYQVFTPSISGSGVITLVAWANPGDVLLPVTSGHIPIFNGTTGQIKDSTVAFSNATDTVSPLFHGTATAGDFVTVNNANKTIQDSGAAPSAASQPFVVMSPGSVTSGNLVKFSDANGTVADAGGALHAGTTSAYAGGGTSNAFTTTNMTASSIVTATILSQTNAASIVKAVPGTNTLTVTFSADPGANTTVNWISITPAIA